MKGRRLIDRRGWFIFTGVIVFLLLMVNACRAQVTVLTNVQQAFENIPARPYLLKLLNRLHKASAGGHLQGIQLAQAQWAEPGWNYNGLQHVFEGHPDPAPFFIITGSSNKYSYYVKAKRVSENYEVTDIHKLEGQPFRHAGGCQAIDNKLAVGIEDNQGKSKSKVVLISMPDTGKSCEKVVIDRQGSFKRSTAGAVGITKIHGDHYLVAVGDWDSRNIDFYLSRLYSGKAFDSLSTFRAPVNEKWCSYQSINLLSDSTGNLFLIGFSLDGNKNRADLFKVSLEKDGAIFALVSTRYFNCRKGAGFRYGSGIGISGNRLVIYACQRRLKKTNTINIFETLPKFEI